MNHQDQSETYRNAANVRDMDIPKPTVFTATGVSNVQAIITLNIAYVKKNLNMSSASFAMATIRPNYKGCTVYKDIQKRTFPPLRNELEDKPLAAKPQLYIRPDLYSATLSSQQQQYATAKSSIQKIPTQQQQTHPQTSEIHELQTMLKRLMAQLSTMLHLLTTVVSKIN